MRSASDKRINKWGELKIDKRYHISFCYYGSHQGKYSVTFPVLDGEWLGIFDNQDEAVQFATNCHKYNYATCSKMWGINQQQLQKMFDKLDNQNKQNA